jgi:hypothetical protein
VSYGDDKQNGDFLLVLLAFILLPFIHACGADELFDDFKSAYGDDELMMAII